MTSHCERCGSRGADVERRLDYRSASLKRVRTWRVELLCQDCAASDYLEHDRAEMVRKHPGLFPHEQSSQEALW